MLDNLVNKLLCFLLFNHIGLGNYTLFDIFLDLLLVASESRSIPMDLDRHGLATLGGPFLTDLIHCLGILWVCNFMDFHVFLKTYPKLPKQVCNPE